MMKLIIEVNQAQSNKCPRMYKKAELASMLDGKVYLFADSYLFR